MRKILLFFSIFFVLGIILPGQIDAQINGSPADVKHGNSVATVGQVYCGSGLPIEIVEKCLVAAASAFPGQTYEDLLAAYIRCDLTITPLGEGKYLIAYGGSSTIVTIMDGF